MDPYKLFLCFLCRKIELEYFHYFVTIEYLRYSFEFKKDGAKRHPQIFNFQFPENRDLRFAVTGSSGFGLER